MAMITSFILDHVLALLERELLAKEPEAQAALLAEVDYLVNKLGEWIKDKLSNDDVVQ